MTGSASERQNQAATPKMSTWLAANAGSGKTRVLTDRVARLLLEGTDPQKILCLTYTKAAAGEMQNRLFSRLGGWAMLDDERLSAALVGLDAGDAVSAERLHRARTLFARAIETPGGLKIQTIHSFCAALLRRFPLEAGVSPAFTELDDRAGALLRDEILNDIAEGESGPLLGELCRYATDQSLTRLVDGIVGLRHAFDGGVTRADLLRSLGLPAGFDRDDLSAAVFHGDEAALLADIAAVLAQHGSTDAEAARRLKTIGRFDWHDLPVLEQVFLYGKAAKAPHAAKLDRFPTKACRAALGDLLEPMQALMRRVEAARPMRIALLAAEKSRVLHAFARVFLAELERRKQARGWLDFDDLIHRARQLLNTPEVADWVLYRLDGGIDHVLVDEAQDTSPDQWDIIEKLTREFTAGAGARPGVTRTLFVVGDKKQSIYSFQGADPREFDRMKDSFGQKFRNAGDVLQNLLLEFSFRSSDAILQLVDQVFEDKAPSGFPAAEKHKAFKADLPGRVDLWPVVPVATAEEDRPWTDPVDKPGPRHHVVELAGRIAETIECLLRTGETIPVDGSVPGTYQKRRIVPGDFLILLQRRSQLFAEIIRACKARNLPIAGADRLRVGGETAVKDLAALLRFLATPEDSLSLAEALRSPLFGWDEQALFDLAHRRTERHLWQTLRARRAEFTATMEMIDDLRGQADFLRPYDLIERILTRHDGRRRLMARLGREAEDGIDALLSQALAYEQNQVPTLTGFLVWMETDDLEIKRQSDSSGGLIRVMTVHGAKGLESPIVILPDTATRKAPGGSEILLADGIPFWRPGADEMPEPLAQAAAERQLRDLQERDRLLYVALTRAEKWLIVAAAGEVGGPGESWYADVAAAMARLRALPADMPGGTGLRLSHADWTGLPQEDAPAPAAPQPSLPALFAQPHEQPDRASRQISPSDLGGAKALPGEEGLRREEAMARGDLIHLLLEHLPRLDPADRVQAAEALLPEDAPGDVLAEVMRLLDAQELGFVFAPEALAEVTVTAELGPHRLLGVIDRLIVEPERVLAIDFKSNAIVPAGPEACPEGILRQMGAYAHALAQVYPGRRIETAVIWTHSATFMSLPHDLVTSALARTGWVDDMQAAT